MNDFIQRLRERKLVQWALAYIAAAFALIGAVRGRELKLVRWALVDSILRSAARFKLVLKKMGLPYVPQNAPAL